MKVSVILSSYNHAKYIKQSIESVLNQTFQDFELFIIDDCSSDNSKEIIDCFNDQRITRIYHQENHGEGIVKEGVFKYATGEYIAVHHSDDIWEKDKLEKQVKFLDAHAEYAGVFSNAEVIDDDGKIYDEKEGFYYHLFQKENRSRYEWLNRFFYKGNCLCHPSVLMRRKVYYDIEPFVSGLKQIPDMYMWIKICLKYEIFILPEKLVKFRVHRNGENTSGLRVDSQIRSSIELNLMLGSYLQLKEKEEFLKVFPHAGQYASGDVFLIEYAFARVCLEDGVQGYTRLFGLQLLYNLLNDANKSSVIKEQYNYTHKNFKTDTGNVDIFRILPSNSEQTATLYWDTGDGWKENNRIEYRYFLGKEYEFEWIFPLDEIRERILRLRFDPAEGVIISCVIKSCKIDGIDMELMAENIDLGETEDVFLSLDPIYTLSKEIYKKKEIRICGKLVRLSDFGLMDSVRKISSHIVFLTEKIESVEKDYEDAKNLFIKERKIKEDNTINFNLEREKLLNENKKLDDDYRQLDVRYENLEADYKELEKGYKELEAEQETLYRVNQDMDMELNRIKTHWCYRCLKKINESRFYQRIKYILKKS